MTFASLEQLKSRVFKDRAEGESELKKAGFPVQTAAYRLAESDSGSWQIEEIDPDASQESPDPPLNTGQKPKPMTRIKAASKAVAKPAKAAAKPKAAPPPKAAPAPKAVPKPAKAAAKPDGPRNKSSDPSPDELPKGFDAWVVAQASSAEGVLRTEVAKRAGVDRRWQNHLKALAKTKGLVFAMKREGRFTRFLMTKPD